MKNIYKIILFILLGLLLGIFAKGIDTIALMQGNFFHNILGMLDLGNMLSRLSIWAFFALIIAICSKIHLKAALFVFSFFVGMMIGYYSYTIYIAGFFPKSYIIAWSIITIITPLLAYIIWFAKNKNIFSIFILSIINAFFSSQTFAFGRWYIDISYISELLIFIGVLIFLYFHANKKYLGYSMIGGIILAPFIEMTIILVFGGL